MSAVAPASTVSAESEQPPNTTDVPGPSVHPDVKLSPVQIPVEVPLTDQPTTAGLGIVVLPMIRKRQASLNVMPLRRPATHSKRHDLSVNAFGGGPGTQFAAKTRSRVSPLADRPVTVRPWTKQP